MKINTTRFSGFSTLYDETRPQPPKKIVDIIKIYKNEIDTIVDLGSGTGLSTIIWRNTAKHIIGIEPTSDMRIVAEQKYTDIKFIDANSYNTTLENNSIDVVTCSQSFHWMEPFKTIEEVNRILISGGIFAVYDCKWPVIWSWKAEVAYK